MRILQYSETSVTILYRHDVIPKNFIFIDTVIRTLNLDYCVAWRFFFNCRRHLPSNVFTKNRKKVVAYFRIST